MIRCWSLTCRFLTLIALGIASLIRSEIARTSGYENETATPHFLKHPARKSVDRGVTTHKMKTNHADISEQSQRELAAGVLKQAGEDLRRFHGMTSRVERELYLSAYSWVMLEDYSWPFSFSNVCRMLNRVPEDVRQELVGDLAFGSFGQWARRCRRGVRQVVASLSERLEPEYDGGSAVSPHLTQTWH